MPTFLQAIFSSFSEDCQFLATFNAKFWPPSVEYRFLALKVVRNWRFQKTDEIWHSEKTAKN